MISIFSTNFKCVNLGSLLSAIVHSGSAPNEARRKEKIVYKNWEEEEEEEEKKEKKN